MCINQKICCWLAVERMKCSACVCVVCVVVCVCPVLQAVAAECPGVCLSVLEPCLLSPLPPPSVSLLVRARSLLGSHCLTHALSLTQLLSLTHTLSLSITHTLCLSLSLSLSLYLSLSVSLSLYFSVFLSKNK